MLNIDEKTLHTIIKKEFNSLVGTSCETIEVFNKDDIKRDTLEKMLKEVIKKYSYNAMRNIEGKISAFSKGVKFNINFKKPISE